MFYEIRDSQISKSDAARQCGFNSMRVGRYCQELSKRGLITESKKKQTIQISCSAIGQKLFEKALPYLRSPIKRTIILQHTKELDSTPMSGESSLSMRSMLAPPKIPVTACGPHTLLAKKIGISKYDQDLFQNTMELQVWGYDPSRFVKDGQIDPISLYASLKDSPNERVQTCLKEMLEKEIW